MKNNLSLKLVLATLAFVGLVYLFMYANHEPYDYAALKKEVDAEYAASAPLPVAKQEHYLVSYNFGVNEMIKILEENGWHIKSLVAMNSPCVRTGYYDVLITYE